VLVGLGVEDHIEWGEPSMQYFMGGVDLKDRKKRAREFLRENDLYLTGSMMGQKDADDAISAELHAIAWLRRKRHMPTLQALFRRQ
jgi:TorA maturation chaperone TorD